jgi:hypothetical protein
VDLLLLNQALKLLDFTAQAEQGHLLQHLGQKQLVFISPQLTLA